MTAYRQLKKVRAQRWPSNQETRYVFSYSDAGEENDRTVKWESYVELSGQDPVAAMHHLRNRYPGYRLEDISCGHNTIAIHQRHTAVLFACDLFWMLNGAMIVQLAQRFNMALCDTLRETVEYGRLWISGVVEFSATDAVVGMLCEIAEGAGTADSLRLAEEEKQRALGEIIEHLDSL